MRSENAEGSLGRSALTRDPLGHLSESKHLCTPAAFLAISSHGRYGFRSELPSLRCTLLLFASGPPKPLAQLKGHDGRYFWHRPLVSLPGGTCSFRLALVTVTIDLLSF